MENQPRAIESYSRAIPLGEPLAYSLLSFYHRYEVPDIARSIAEAKKSLDSIETRLNLAFQDGTGFLRRLSSMDVVSHYT
jgi:hypothetical protein